MVQSNEMSQFEARAYKRLYELYKSTLQTIVHKANITVEYKSENQKEMNEMMSFIADKQKWEYCGIESKIDGSLIKELEKCLTQ